MKKIAGRRRHRTSRDVNEQRRTLRSIRLHIESFFESREKAATWFNTPNPVLGNVRPIEMIRIGRADKLLRFIEGALAT
jgi:uncharacterized protein (DUF2384 family)